jgi:integrase
MKHTTTTLPHGDGSLGYERSRQCHTLRHTYGGKAHIERSRKCLGGKDECAAREAEVIAARNRRRRDVDVRGTLVGDTTLGAVASTWADGHTGSKSTVDGYRASARLFTERLGADVDMEDLTADDVRDRVWRHLVVDLGRKRDTVAKRRTHWNQLLAHAVDDKKLTPGKAAELASNARDKTTPKPAHQPPRHAWHTLKSYGKVRHYLARPDGSVRDALFLTMLMCGLRPSEAEGLKWEYVDLDADVIAVEGCIKDTDDGRAWSPVLKTDPHHPKGHRRVPIAHDLKVVLRRLELQAAPGAEFVFVERDGKRRGRRVNSDSITKHAKEIALETGTRWIHPNGYRHTFASVCLHGGMRPEDLAVLMGHADTTEITKTYGHALGQITATDMAAFMGGATG